MRTKKISLILIVVAFILIAILSTVSLFYVRKAQVNFAVSEKTDSSEIQQLLDGYIGKNLLFLDTEEIVQALKGYHYLEVVRVDKKYPNVIEVSLKERREVYYFEQDGKVYITNEDGFVLNSYSGTVQNDNRQMIKLEVKGVNVLQATPGSVLKTDSEQLMTAVFEMAKSVNLTNCIKAIKVDKPAPNELADVEFDTYTGVKIRILKAEESGVNKINQAFNVYDSEVSDYEKAFDKLLVSKNSQTGEIQVTWSDGSLIGQ